MRLMSASYFYLFMISTLFFSCSPQKLPEPINCAIDTGHSGTATEEMRLEYHVVDKEMLKASFETLTDEQAEKLLKSSQMVIVLNAKGLPPGEHFVLCSVASNNTITVLDEWSATLEGEVLNTKDLTPLNKKFIFLKDFMNGEKFGYVLSSKKKHCFVGITLYPNPLQAEWSDDAYMMMKMIGSDTKSFSVECEGLVPAELLIITSKSFDEVMCYPSKASLQGTWSGLIHPGITGELGGQALFQIERPRIGEKRRICYSWYEP